ncbi:hypothetical protein F5X96DRAFT_658347 [Biscogniauxia mediterranea]|nr:hypothetical protein F5X96DRAFT_658347 [Biscogniauxia mediterranea]
MLSIYELCNCPHQVQWRPLIYTKRTLARLYTLYLLLTPVPVTAVLFLFVLYVYAFDVRSIGLNLEPGFGPGLVRTGGSRQAGLHIIDGLHTATLSGLEMVCLLTMIITDGYGVGYGFVRRESAGESW